MASIVLFEKDAKKYNCGDCMDGSNWKRQGRTDEHIRKRIKDRLRNKGCLSDAKNAVLRLNNGERVYRCPRATSNSGGAISHFEEVVEIMDGKRRYDPESKPWKWHAVKRRIQNEILQVRRLHAENLRNGR